ncbi:uncharacterized protein LOC111694259 [Trichogramma pretiosum]|uniref:uncharacterized protein LOC111693596 n=1 Tax=Trichogramma pretiosum TaxID=7493 RepID=UPI000C719636|nr:uncharacterized protein LOC111693596 [Trichogramma pretiosum]XP_023315318.1 uncharacterized protein LOC111693805 [Trichogramma pretiosum]XP_023317472.1 uncharacterized protein LOC111694259 [Trichogramma pretiosum]
MPKKSKREREPEERLERLLKKVRKLNAEVENVKTGLNKDEDGGNKSPLGDENASPNTNNGVLQSPPPRDPLSPEGTESEGKTIEEEDDETIDDDNWNKIIGEDPSSAKGEKLSVKKDLLKIWQFLCRDGMSKEKEEALIEKYQTLEELAPPDLNPQLDSILKETAKKRDKYMLAVQKTAAQGLSIIGSIMTNIYNNAAEGMDIEDVLSPLKEAGDLLCLIINKQSKNRKAFIEPGLAKDSAQILKNTKIDEFLYGKDLSSKIKETKALSKEGQEFAKPVVPSKNLNTKSPNVGRRVAGNTFIGGRPKQQLFFRNSQQFVNNRGRSSRGRGGRQAPYSPNQRTSQ